MRYRAVAVASERSNAVGSVELECTPHGLFVAYVAVGAFQSGYAPGALTSGTGLTVPWTSIQEAHVEGTQVLVTFDHRLTPLNRLLLMHFVTGQALPPEELVKRRLVVRLAAVSAALSAGLILSASLLRSWPEVGAGAAILVAALAAALLVGVGFFVDRNLASQGDELGALASFALELTHYLPSVVHLPRPPEASRKFPEISELQGLLPRTTLAIVITLTAGALGVLLVARWVTTDESAVARVTHRMLAATSINQPASGLPIPLPRSAPAQSSRTTAPTAKGAAMPGGIALGSECACQRADSLLWAEAIPRLSLVVLGQRTRQGRGPEENLRKRYLELDLAVVNNSNEPIREVALLVLFFERDSSSDGKRTQVDTRPLFFEGPLVPGQAIKWSMEAEGTEFTVENPFRGPIGTDGEYAAPPSRIAELLQAKNRPVRLHAAMLLAFLGDARAREGALTLREALREDEASYLTRVLHATAEMRVCQLQVVGSGRTRSVSACIFNASSEPERELGIQIRGLDGPVSPDTPTAVPPTVVVESAFPISGELPARTGRGIRMSLQVESKSPTVYEAHADQYHLLATR